jgi:hypothetical protein
MHVKCRRIQNNKKIDMKKNDDDFLWTRVSDKTGVVAWIWG